MGDLGLIPGLGRSPREGKGYPLQYSGVENFIDCIVHGVAKVGHDSDFKLYKMLAMKSLNKNRNRTIFVYDGYPFI